MLKSKFAKDNSKFKAQKIFTDRVEPRKVFETSIANWGSKPSEILVFYGVGGIGKTELLKMMAKEGEKHYKNLSKGKVNPIFISLDAFDFSNPINVLMTIRNEIKGDCGLFDYAMMRYCAEAKLSIQEIKQKYSILSSPVVGVLNELISLGTMSVTIPAATLQKCTSFIEDGIFKLKHKEDIKELEHLNAFEIFERLPYYLGLSIAHAAEKGNYHIIFMDSYESLLARTKYGTASVGQEEWLQELFLTSGNLRIVIASRDRLRWDQEDAEWGNYIDQHLLTNLSDEDSRWFLSNIPIKDEEIIDVIVNNAGGVPLYLDICASLYEDAKNHEAVFHLTSEENGEKLISRYVRHLSDKDKKAVSILAAPHSFDLNFADELLKKMGVLYCDDELKVLLDKSIFKCLDETRDIWKVDESVRLHQRARINTKNIAKILESMLDIISISPDGRYYIQLALVVESVCRWPEILEQVSSKCIQAIECYANAGFWGELHLALEQYLNHNDKRLCALAVMEEIIYLRRTGKLRECQNLIEQYPLEKEILGNWYYMYQYMTIQNRHLLGYYEESLGAYKDLIEEMDLIRVTIPNHIYIAPCIKYADLLFLNGNFKEALEQVNKLLNNNELSIGDTIELMRIEGHIYRFQQSYSKAQIIYGKALELAQEHNMRAYIGKLYTNLAEALCVFAPKDALEWYQKADEENCSVNNDIELGKAYVAASAAHTSLGNYDEAVLLAKKAIETAEKTGYLSGQAFGYVVLYYTYKKQNDITSAKNAEAKLENIISKTGVYKYLLERIKE